MVLRKVSADNSIADDFLKWIWGIFTYYKNYFNFKAHSYGVVYCVAEEEELIGGNISKVANQCMQMRGVSTAFMVVIQIKETDYRKWWNN